MKRFILCLLVIIINYSKALAQQDPQYTQYMYNMNIVNPACAGSKDDLSLGILGRSQWANIEGAPKTLTMAVHAPTGKNIGLGLSVITDKIGPVIEQNLFFDFSYAIQVSETGKLAFGIKAGVTFHNLDQHALTTNDPDFQSFVDMQNKTIPNFGGGIFYYNETTYVGLSVPNLRELNHFQQGNGKFEASEKIHYFLTAGHVFQLSETVKYKPSFMVKATPDAPFSVDLSSNVLLNDRLELGASYRVGDAISGLVNFGVTEELRIGYAYDFTTSNLGPFNAGSHEIIILWNFNLFGDGRPTSRFF